MNRSPRFADYGIVRFARAFDRKVEMRCISVGRAALLGIVCVLLMLAGPAQAAKRIALVIGNNDYRN